MTVPQGPLEPHIKSKYNLLYNLCTYDTQLKYIS